VTFLWKINCLFFFVEIWDPKLFTCDENINRMGVNLTGTLPECSACSPLNNTDVFYDTSDCERVLGKNQVCSVSCANSNNPAESIFSCNF
jgi:hypothetical protein